MTSERNREYTEKSDPARRADNTWLWSGLSITIIENTIDLADLEQVVEEIQPEFMDVNIRRGAAGPMATPLFGDAALVLAFAIAAHGFLSEAGKDLYRGFRAALFAAYNKARTWANERGYTPLRIEIRYDSEPVIVFIFESGMDRETFEGAMQAFLRTHSELDPSSLTHAVVMEFDQESGSWKEAEFH